MDGPGPCSVVSYCPWMYGDVEGWAAGDEKGWWRRRERVRWGGVGVELMRRRWLA